MTTSAIKHKAPTALKDQTFPSAAKAPVRPTQPLSDLARLAQLFDLSLASRNLAKTSRATYGHALHAFEVFLTSVGMPLVAESITREHIQHFMTHLLETRSPATAGTYYAALRTFFKWLVEEDEIDRSPMERIRPPVLPEKLVPVLGDEQVAALLKACEGKTFEARRDMAIFRLLFDTGMRRAELLGLRVDDINLDVHVAKVMGKGRRERYCPFVTKTALALGRYLRVRAQHRHADSPELWLGRKGPLSVSGLRAMLERRGKEAGLEGFHTHLTRHFWAHIQLAAGAQQQNVQHLGGWRSSKMLGRYGAALAAERARDEHQRLAVLDRF